MREYARRAEMEKASLYRTAVLFLKSPSAAEEALDEAIYRGLRSCRSLRDPGAFRTWLTRILQRVCLDELRRQKRVETVEIPPETAWEAPDTLPLRQAVDRLPQELREVVLLHYFAGYTLAETAEILEIPPGTAATRQRRALQLLRQAMGEEDAE